LAVVAALHLTQMHLQLVLQQVVQVVLVISLQVVLALEAEPIQ
jgi:hypothetical protein